MNREFDLHDYSDILSLPYPTPTDRPRMSLIDRAAQFSPFAALTGYEGEVLETARQTTERIELSEDARELLDRKQQLLLRHLEEHPLLTVTYFLPDLKKAGGIYQTVTGNLLRIEEYEELLIFTDGREIPVREVTDLDSPLFTETDGFSS